MRYPRAPASASARAGAPASGPPARAGEPGRPAPLAALLGLLSLLLILSACAPGTGPSGVAISITDCMDPARADSADVRRNLAEIRRAPLCYRREAVREGPFHWTFHILEHRGHADGPLWVLPHDNENTAFDVAVQAVIRYGGGLLAVDAGGARQFRGQDPNRNFGATDAESRVCIGQRRPAPGYTRAVLAHFKGRPGPILALHNNHDGWAGDGGYGNISLYRETPSLRAYPGRGADRLRDADDIVMMAGPRPLAADPARRRRVDALNAAGLNVMYKTVDGRNFDCSLSDYVSRHGLGDYYNIEAEYDHREVQLEMVVRLMETLGIRPLRRAAAPSPFLGR